MKTIVTKTFDYAGKIIHPGDSVRPIRDLFSSDGVLLIPKDTIINQIDCWTHPECITAYRVPLGHTHSDFVIKSNLLEKI